MIIINTSKRLLDYINDCACGLKVCLFIHTHTCLGMYAKIQEANNRTVGRPVSY